MKLELISEFFENKGFSILDIILWSIALFGKSNSLFKNWKKSQKQNKNGCGSNFREMWKFWILSDGNVWFIWCRKCAVIDPLLFTNDNQFCS